MILTAHQLHSIVGGELRLGPLSVHGVDKELTRVVTDSGQVRPGDVFWGLQGSRQDGASFAADAMSRGAAGVVAANCHVVPRGDCFSIRVQDGLAALRSLAAWHRDQFTGTAVAVTGSVGKTTTREMIRAVLGQSMSGSASPENYNNHV